MEPEEGRETLLVIVGAGASHDCLSGRPDLRQSVSVPGSILPTLRFADVIPPLTQSLVEKAPLQNRILINWQSAQPVADDLRKELSERKDPSGRGRTETLERALAKYGQETHPYRHRHLLGMRHYLRDLLWACTDYMQSPDLSGGITNYTRLVAAAFAWRGMDPARRCIVFVSFNYDLLLERAIESHIPFDPLKMADYTRDPMVSVLKPHGSVQWYWNLSKSFPDAHIRTRDMRQLAWSSMDAMVDQDPQMIEQGELQNLRHSPHRDDPNLPPIEGPMIPALALPIDQKTSFVWPTQQGERAEQLCPGAVTRLLSVGWRGAEDHFMGLLRRMLAPDAKAFVVSRNDGGHVAGRLRDIGMQGHAVDWLDEGFSAFCKPERIDTWLHNYG